MQVSLGVDAEPPGDEAGIESIPPGESKKHLALRAVPRARLPRRHRAPPRRSQSRRRPARGRRARHRRDQCAARRWRSRRRAARKRSLLPPQRAHRPCRRSSAKSITSRPKTVSPAELSVRQAQRLRSGRPRQCGRRAGRRARESRQISARGRRTDRLSRRENERDLLQREALHRARLSARGVWRAARQRRAAGAVLPSPVEELRASDRLALERSGGGLASARRTSTAPSRCSPRSPTSARADIGPPALVLSYADGQPAVMERTWGYGRVIQFSSTADSAWNDLCIRPIFVPLMHRILGAIVTRQDEHLNLRVGAQLSSVMDRRIARQGRDASSNPAEKRTRPPAARRAQRRAAAAATSTRPTWPACTTRARATTRCPLLRFATQADPGGIQAGRAFRRPT